jgi:hypothetical protein
MPPRLCRTDLHRVGRPWMLSDQHLTSQAFDVPIGLTVSTFPIPEEAGSYLSTTSVCSSGATERLSAMSPRSPSGRRGGRRHRNRRPIGERRALDCSLGILEIMRGAVCPGAIVDITLRTVPGALWAFTQVSKATPELVVGSWRQKRPSRRTVF